MERSFGVVPYWSAVNNYPRRSIPYPASVMVPHAFDKENGGPVGGLHMEQEVITHRPIDPTKGSFVFEDTITDVFDRGEGKGIIVRSNMPVYGEAGSLVCENNSSTLIFAGGEFGGKQPPKNTVEIPAWEPVFGRSLPPLVGTAWSGGSMLPGTMRDDGWPANLRDEQRKT